MAREAFDGVLVPWALPSEVNTDTAMFVDVPVAGGATVVIGDRPRHLPRRRARASSSTTTAAASTPFGPTVASSPSQPRKAAARGCLRTAASCRDATLTHCFKLASSRASNREMTEQSLLE